MDSYSKEYEGVRERIYESILRIKTGKDEVMPDEKLFERTKQLVVDDKVMTSNGHIHSLFVSLLEKNTGPIEYATIDNTLITTMGILLRSYCNNRTEEELTLMLRMLIAYISTTYNKEIFT